MTGTGVERPDIDPTQDPLWQRLEAFDLDAVDGDLKFSDRLARENGWTTDYAKRVIEEYKRFCYLALRAGHSVTPSDQVDQAWHLHLSYSRNYWNEFCPKVLQSDLHHDPTRGGTAEAKKYRDWYEATLASYERISGERPPSDIWPDPGKRFSDAEFMRRISTVDRIVLPRPSRGAVWIAQVASVIAVVVSLWLGAGDWAMAFAAGAVGIYVYRARTDNPVRSRRSDRAGRPGAGCAGSGCGGAGCGGGG